MRKSLVIILSCFILGLLPACTPQKSIDFEAEGFEKYHHTDEFSIYQKEEEYLIEISHPFPTATRAEYYQLFPAGQNATSIPEITQQIAYPITSMAISSTTHYGYVEALGLVDFIIGASSPQLFYSDRFQSNLDSGMINPIGSTHFNKEILIKSNVNVLFSYALDQASFDEIASLRESGIKVVLVSEFLETDPLKKAEWLKFFALFFGEEKLKRSEAYLTSIGKQYRDIKEAVSHLPNKPKVLMGYPWKGVWHVSGGASYQAQFFEDAGAIYPWAETKAVGSLPLDVEVVLVEGLDCDFWINPGNKQSVDQITEEHADFAQLKAVRKQQVYSNYARSKPSGANDYWERGVVRPDLILADLVNIFHPQLLPDSALYFYKKI